MATSTNKKAVILAAGCGTRMRQANPGASLSAQQAEIADQGIKALIPIGRPFLDYSLSSVADAGYEHVCLIISPQQDQLREYCEGLDTQRLQVEYAIQHEQTGTASALAAAEDFAGKDSVLVLNGDNYYPVAAMQKLLETEGSSLVGFERDGLIESSNIPADRVAAFSVIQSDDQGNLKNIVEKPDPKFVAQLPAPILVGMNCWRLGPAIFEACRKISPSSRGEYEIPDAVMHMISELGEKVRVVPFSGGVLDLSSRGDIEHVKRRLENTEVRL